MKIKNLIIPLAVFSALPAVTQTYVLQAKETKAVQTRQDFTLCPIDISEEDNNTIVLHFAPGGEGPENDFVFLPEQENMVTVVPAVQDMTVSFFDEKIILNGKFERDTRYKITVKRSIRTNRKGKLKRDAVAVFKTGKALPLLQFRSDGLYFPVGAKNFSLPLEFPDVPKFKISLYRSYDSNLRLDLDTDASNSEPVVEGKVLDFTKEQKAGAKFGNLDLSQFISNRQPGIYRLDIRDAVLSEYDYDNWRFPNHWYRYDGRTIIITDLGVSAWYDTVKNRVHVSVRSLSTGKEITGAKVSLISRAHQVLGEAVTEDGEAEFTFTDPKGRDDAELFTVEYGKDATRLELWRSSLSYNNNGEDLKKGLNAFVYSQRDIIRPGETFRISFFLRERKDMEAAQPRKGIPVKLMLQDPKGKIIAVKPVTSGEQGYGQADFTIPKDAATGSYRVLCGLSEKQVFGGFSFFAGVFIPDRIKVGLKAPGKLWDGRSAYDLFSSAEYYFGGDVKEGTAMMNAEIAGPANPGHFKGWTVGTTRIPQIELLNVKKEDLSQKLSFTVPAQQEEVLNRIYAPALVQADLTVAEPGGRAVTANTSFTLCSTPCYIGLKNAEEQKPGKAHAFAMTLLPADPSKPYKGKAIVPKLTLTKLIWQYNFIRNENTVTRDWEEIRVPVKLSVEAPVLSANVTAWNIPDLAPGRYELTAEADGMVSTMEFWHDEGDGGLYSRDPKVLVFKTDKDVYAPGDVAAVTFAVPACSRIHVVSGEHGIDAVQKYYQDKAGAFTVKVKILEKLETSVWHSMITAISGSNADTKRTAGVIALKVDQKGHRLNPELILPQKAKPGEKVCAKINLTDGTGAAKGGLVHIFAVDEGVLALTGFHVPEIFKHFYGETSWSVKSPDIYSALYPDLKFLPDGSIGGGEGAAKKKRPDMKLKDIAITVLDPVMVPESGKAEFTLPLPEHTGAMRVMAVAANEKSMGQAETSLAMRDEAGVLISAPAMVSPGDTFNITLNVFNHELKDTSFSLEVKLPDMLKAENAKFTFDNVKVGESRTVTVKATALKAIGSGKIEAVLQANGSVFTASEPVTVRIPTQDITQGEIIVLPAGAAKKITILSSAWYEAEHTLTVSNSPVLNAADGLNYLVKYPYGCLEQIVSGAFPFLAAENLVRSGLLPADAAATAQDKIASSAGQVLGRMLYNGSFAMWSGETVTWQNASVYAAHYLFEAESRGYITIDQKSRDKIISYLERIAGNSSTGHNRLLRAYACYALAAAGQDSFTKNARNILLGKEKDYAALIAALSMIRGKYAEEGADKVHDLLEEGVWNFAETIVGDDQSAGYGMLLAMLMENTPDEKAAHQIVRKLSKTLRADGLGWGTTQSNAWAVMGLAAYGAKYPPAKAMSWELTNKEGVKKFAAASVEKLKTDTEYMVKNTGKGPLTIRLTSSGKPVAPDENTKILKIRREYLNEKGEPVSEVKHGELVTVKIYVSSRRDVENMVICDMLPAGLEVEDASLQTRQRKKAKTGESKRVWIRNTEKWIDRILFFGEWPAKENSSAKDCVIYRARAVTPGVFHPGVCTAEDMYDPDCSGAITGDTTFTIK